MNQDNTYPNAASYQAHLNSDLYKSDSPEGKAFRAGVNEKLSTGQNIPVDENSNDGRLRAEWLRKDGLR